MVFLISDCNSIMKQFYIIAASCLTIARLCGSQTVDLSIPEDMLIGSATSAYQVEGAWNVSDKGESIYDWWTHNKPEYIADGSNGDIACNSYYQYEEDVQWIKELGLDFYRFSISWTRVLPSGFADQVSQDGIQYYKNLTEALIANNITPVVTLYHWDHPRILEDLGGWTNELMVGWFSDYARIIFQELGPLVKMFVTINEPESFCSVGYNNTLLAPGKLIENMGHYLCLHNTLKAHAAVYHMYDEEFRPEQQGQIGWAVACSGWVTTDDTNMTLVDQYFQFYCGWPMHPIYIGDYPEIMKTRIAMISELEGYPFSRLPEFSNETISYIKGTSDFFGLNHYSSYIISADPDEELGIFTRDDGVILSANESWSANGGVPEGFGNLLRFIKDQYDNPPVFIFENGRSDAGGLDDYERISYFHGYLSAMLSAVKEDGCNVVGYTIWSLLDNFQWWDGYESAYGIVHVNFTDPNRERTAKMSAYWWQELLQNRTIPDVPVQNSTAGT